MNEPRIVQYETKQGDFDYASFWKTRAYEHRAEKILITRWLSRYPRQAGWLVDIGGSFGRLLPVYAQRFAAVAITDYATSEFHLAPPVAKEEGLALRLIAANAYHLPFKDNSQAAIISVRLLHHLEDPERFLSELERILCPGGVIILEAASKNHLKLLFASLIKLNFKDWRAKWRDIGHTGDLPSGNFNLIRNYHPRYIEGLLSKTGLKVVRRCSISWFRRTWLRRLPKPIIDSLERFCQFFFGGFLLAPSNWYLLKKPGQVPKVHFVQTLRHPNGQNLTQASFKRCHKQNKAGVKYLDLRYPSPKA